MKGGAIGLASLGVAMVSSGMAYAGQGLTQTVYHNPNWNTAAYSFVNSNDAFQYWDDSSISAFFGADANGVAATDSTPVSSISLTASGYIDVLKAGDYTFSIDADDYSNVHVDGVDIIDGNYGPYTVVENLGVGYHSFQLNYVGYGEPNSLFYSLTDPDGASGVSRDFKYMTSISAAPEPSTWAMTIAGIALVGATLRYRQRRGWTAAAA